MITDECIGYESDCMGFTQTEFSLGFNFIDFTSNLLKAAGDFSNEDAGNIEKCDLIGSLMERGGL